MRVQGPIGFTLIGLLIVVAIIGIIAAIDQVDPSTQRFTQGG